MTNKKKQRAKKLSEKSGMSHAAAMNKLNEALLVRIGQEDPVEGHGLHNLRRRPTRPEDVTDMDQELIEFFGPPKLEIQDIPPLEMEIEDRALYTRAGERRGHQGLYRGVLLDPEYCINKIPQDKPLKEVRWIPPEQQFKRPAPKPGKNMRPMPPVPGYRGYNWVYIKNVKEEDFALFREKPPWHMVDDPASNMTELEWQKLCFKKPLTFEVTSLAAVLHRITVPDNVVPLVFTNRRLSKQGTTPVVVMTIQQDDLPKIRDRLEVPPKWLRDKAIHRQDAQKTAMDSFSPLTILRHLQSR